MTATQQSLPAFIAANRIRMIATLTDRNPHMNDMPPGSAHWSCEFRKSGRRMSVYFSQGPAACKEPTAADVLSCLASDASSVDQARSFEEWASDLGYEPDSRKAERTFKACEAQAVKLRKLLGDELYQALLYSTEPY